MATDPVPPRWAIAAVLALLLAVFPGCMGSSPDPGYGPTGGFGPDFGDAFFMAGLIFLAGLLTFLGVSIWMCVFLYRDARRTGQDERVWLALGVFFNVFAWAAYMILRPRPPNERRP